MFCVPCRIPLSPLPLLSPRTVFVFVVEMSLGWLQENTLTKRQAKPLEGAGSGSVLGLKNALYAKESELRAHAQTGAKARAKFTPLKPASNDPLDRMGPSSGLASRQARDAAAHALDAASSGDGPARQTAAALHLAHKARLYDALVNGDVGAEGAAGTFLVDFQRKGWQEADERAAGISALQATAADAASVASHAAAASSSAVAIRVAAASHSDLDSDDPLANQRSAWEQAALASLAASSTQARDAALKLHSASAASFSSAAAGLHPADDSTMTTDPRASLLSASEGMSAREKHALERRKRKALVALRRDLIAQKEARKSAFEEAHRPQSQQPSVPAEISAQGGWVQIQ